MFHHVNKNMIARFSRRTVRTFDTVSFTYTYSHKDNDGDDDKYKCNDNSAHSISQPTLILSDF